MLSEHSIAHIFGEKYSNLVVRNTKLSWQQSLLATESSPFSGHGNSYLEDMYCSQSVHGVCAPIVGYEVLPKRKACTVFKINVILEEKNWFVFKTYADFVDLDKELRRHFPGMCVKLPPNSIFKNKYSAKFLERRRRDLQIYMDVLMRHDAMSNCATVREFLCLSQPPGPYNDLAHSKAYCEQMEENVDQLNRKIKELQTELDATKSRLAQTLTQNKVIEAKNKVIEAMCSEELKKKNHLLHEKRDILNGLRLIKPNSPPKPTDKQTDIRTVSNGCGSFTDRQPDKKHVSHTPLLDPVFRTKSQTFSS